MASRQEERRISATVSRSGRSPKSHAEQRRARKSTRSASVRISSGTGVSGYRAPSIHEGIGKLLAEPGPKGLGLPPLLRIQNTPDRSVLSNPGQMGCKGETGAVRVGIAAGPLLAKPPEAPAAL